MEKFVDYKKFFDLSRIVSDIESYLADFDRDLFIKAFEFSEKAHRGQFRKDGKTPYLSHPINVVKNLMEIHADQDILLSALLHDVPEDTEYTIEDIGKNFGETVAFLVDGITKLSEVKYQHEMTDNKIESLKKLFIHTAKDPRVIIIKLADRLHNMRTLQYTRPDKQARTARETLEIYVPAANLLGLQHYKVPLEDLCFKYLFPTEYAELRKKIVADEKSLKDAVCFFENALNESLLKNNIENNVEKVAKSYFKIYQKLCDLARPVDFIDDRIAINVSVKTIDDCYKALGVIHSKFMPKTDRFKDFIASPKANGYRALHTVVFGIKGRLTELHILTEEMALEAKYGIMAKYFQKSDGNRKFLSADTRSSWIDKIIALEKEDEGKDFLENIKSDILEARMVVFTPKGSKIDLPKGSSAIDFAYAISSTLANKAVKVVINDVSKPLTTTLKSGDIVSVISSESAYPELYWLNFTKTNFARNKLKQYFKKISHEKKLFTGEKLLQREFDIAGLGPCKDMSFKKLKLILKKNNLSDFGNWSDIFIAIGSGEIKAIKIIRAIRNEEQLTEGNYFLDSLFQKQNKERKTVNIKVVANDRPGLGSEIMNIIDKNSVNILLFHGAKPFFSKFAYVNIKMHVIKPKEIGRILYEISQIDGVKEVNRIRYKGIFMFYLALIFAILVWISNSYLINVIIEFGFTNVNKFVAYSLLYMELFLPLLTLLFLTSVLRKYFPVVRDKTVLWLTAFVVLSISVIYLFTKYQKLDVEINFTILGAGVIAVYVYLFFLFRKFKKIKY